MSSEPVLKTESLTKRFGKTTAVDDVSFEIERGETIALIGPNGAGKTTLINCLSGVLGVTDGRIFFDGRDVTDSTSDEMARQGLGRTFQISNLFWDFTTFQNTRLGLQLQENINYNFWDHHKEFTDLADSAEDILDRVGLKEQRDTKAENLSQGQKRQLELGLALSTHPHVLLLDEPTAGLAEDNIDKLITILDELSDDYTILFIEHDIELVMDIADKILVMNQGRIIAFGTPLEIRESDDVQDAYLGTSV